MKLTQSYKKLWGESSVQEKKTEVGVESNFVTRGEIESWERRENCIRTPDSARATGGNPRKLGAETKEGRKKLETLREQMAIKTGQLDTTRGAIRGENKMHGHGVQLT